MLLPFNLPEGAQSFPNRVIHNLPRRVPHKRYSLFSANHPNPIEFPTYLVDLSGSGYRAFIKPFLVNGSDRCKECLRNVIVRVRPLALGVA